MQIIQTPKEWLAIQAPIQQATLGFVPTMGNLHAGHESLLKRAKKENQHTILSIFINPTQFNDPKDLQNYPQTLQEDIAVAEKLDIDWVFVPKPADLYPDAYHYRMTETELSHSLCGAHRSGHFEGVLTIVLKLLLLINPARAYFGEKDFQQLELVRGMVQAFFLPTEVVSCETVRDMNGLALSSRNSRLTSQEYQLALEFPRLLASCQSSTEIAHQLTQLGFLVDYIEEYKGRRLGAVGLGSVRLIDNIPVEFNPIP
jgi:pantoate--beta-alanine ligase